MLGQPRTLGWITDLYLFRHLVSLSLSDNCLDQFPLSLCGLKTLQELDISSNNLRSVPQEIQNLTK
jgi:Leucine-rich repeat (LRR) protein